MQKITIQPTFKYINYFKTFFHNNSKNLKYIFKSGRYSLYYALHTIIKLDKNIHKILLPSLICSELIPIIKHLKLKIEFYSVNNDLTLNQNELEYLLSKEKEKAFFLVINYFGFPTNWDMINKLKDKFDCITIEDNAHALYGSYNNKNLGEYGDISFNSFRKILPLLSGSELVFNKYKPSNNFKYNSRFPTIGEIIYSLRSIKINIFKKIIHTDTKLMPTNIKCENIDYISDRILQKIKFNQKMIIEMRNKNYIFWEKYLQNKDLGFFKNLKINETICPYVFPCYAKSVDKKNKWISWGKQKNISIISWPDLPKLAIPFLKYDNLKHILCFPVNHQFDLTKIIG